MGLKVVRRGLSGIQYPRSVTDTLIDRERTQRDVTELEYEDNNYQKTKASYVSGCRDCRDCRELRVNEALGNPLSRSKILITLETHGIFLT